MAKPAITKRAVKAAALTYAELDTNFQNLADATLTLTAGSGGTQVTADLNGTITLVAGTGITLTGNNTAKTVTITGATTGLVNLVEDTTPQLGGALDVNGQIITSTGNGDIELNPAGTGAVRLIADTILVGDGAGTVTIDTNSGQALQLRDPFTDPTAIGIGATNVTVYGNLAVTGDSITLSGAGGSQNFITTNGDDSITLRTDGTTGSSASVFVSGGANGGVGLVAVGTGFVYTNSAFRLFTLSTTDRDLLTATNGMVIYNTTTHKFQGRANGTWVDLH
jgi:hypothetical protein